MVANKKLFKVPVGDWSDNGHGKRADYYLEANYSAQDMRQAYKDTCKKIGLQMNHNQDYTGIERISSWSSWRHLLTEYEASSIDEKAIDILLEHGYKFSECEAFDEDDNLIKDEIYFNSDSVFDLFMWFISYSMPSDFEYKQVTQEAESIIGYWSDDLNHQIGYGVFY